MSGANRKDDVMLADQFLADVKSLSGAPPEFGPKQNNRRRSRKESFWEAVWPIANSIGIIESGQLRVIVAPASDKPFTIAIVFRGNCLYRLDFVANTICHSNPPFARLLDLPASVCGPHCHPWEVNREHVLSDQLWELPCREPLPLRIRRFDQALPWLAEKIKLVLTPGQREFGPPDELV
jgi:hypothetical protein